ncbi:MAG: hypothetical protein DRH32_06530 [Deltaproteobacteria bacterium]|nr:MAG: hypothetical protein DRH32_06530 [Deltaproteobacteria bacterium]
MHVRHTWPLRSGKQKSVCSYSGLNRAISELICADLLRIRGSQKLGISVWYFCGFCKPRRIWCRHSSSPENAQPGPA